MKRPKSLYILVIFYTVCLLALLWILISGGFGFFISKTQRDLWEYMLQAWSKVLWIYSLLLFITIYGLFQGRSYGRNLSFVSSLLPLLFFGKLVLKIFTVNSQADFRFLTVIFFFVHLFLFLISLIPFYLSFRPEIGRYCKVYPESAFSQKSP